MAEKYATRSRIIPVTQEELRLQQDRARKANWKRWGPYLSERQWSTVREDYSRLRQRVGFVPARSRAQLEPTAGAKTGSAASPTAISIFASP